MLGSTLILVVNFLRRVPTVVYNTCPPHLSQRMLTLKFENIMALFTLQHPRASGGVLPL